MYSIIAECNEFIRVRRDVYQLDSLNNVNAFEEIGENEMMTEPFNGFLVMKP